MVIECLFFAALFALQAPEETSAQLDLVQYVDPFIGTGGHGHTFPGPTRPFGMVQLSPDSRLTGWDGCSGYHYSDDVIYGFSHTHLSGTGVSDYGDILFMPGVGPVQLDSGFRGDGQEAQPEEGYASRFKKETERAEAGYYAVHLEEPNVSVQLTTTPRTGIHSYRFPESAESHIVLDLAHRDLVLASSVRVVNDREVEGMRSSTAWATDQRVFFVARFSKPFTAFGLASDDEVREGVEELAGDNLKGFFRFATTEGEEVMLQVGISSVDLAGARRNLHAETLPWDFEAARELSRQAWQAALSKIVVEGGTLAERRNFYTALYHSSIAPNLFSDVDGRVRGMDGEIHQPGHDVYTVFSLWDTFRATHPLFTLIERERTVDFMKTFLHQFRSGGKLPIWELAGNYTGCMIGYHSIPAIADAHLKGIDGFDANALLDAMIVSADADVLGLDSYKSLGFIPADQESESVSKTLEYGYDDWCIARMAEALGRPELAQRFDDRSQAYRHLFDPSTGFMRPRQNGGWIEPFDPREVNFNFTEANAWQYALFVPHDLEALIEAHGGDAKFVGKLDSLFAASSSTTGRDQADITGLIGQYAHGNEPSHHVSYLYAYAGEPWKTEQRVHQILTELYQDQPDGLSGNEDCGQMSSWFVLSALGFYPVCPGSNEYVLGTPLFDRATLHFEDGKSFTIEAERESEGSIYVQATSLNGAHYSRGYLSHETLTSGGSLKFVLADSPDKTRLRGPLDRPRSRVGATRTLAVPNIRAEGRVFRGTIDVALLHPSADVSLYYTLDGSQPTLSSTLYTGPLVFAESTEVRVIAIAANGTVSKPITGKFKRLDHEWAIHYDTPYSSQYTAGGETGLIDGLRGVADFRVGSWAGWFEEDMRVTVDLGRATEVQRVEVGFLQDIRSWIWGPTSMEIYTSLDGTDFELVAVVESELAQELEGEHLLTLEADLKGAKVRHIRVVAHSLDVIPDWHLGRGNDAWVFCDEIVIE